MNTENVSGDRKRDRKQRLLPLLALIVGICVPVYAYAASEEECQWCHDYCTNTFTSQMQYCQMAFMATCHYEEVWGYYVYMCDYQSLTNCQNGAIAQYQDCHVYCERSGGPCVE